jgi:menaquinone-dependent protoporphyrinogen oxidase
MQEVLIVHGSKYGQTAKIAERIAATLRTTGLGATVMHATAVPPDIDLKRFAGIIVGAPVLVQRHPKSVRQFVTRHLDILDRRTTAFFSVSGSAAGKELSEQADAFRMLSMFLELCRWQPTRTASFAGAFSYTRYGFFLKWVMKRIARQVGQSTDTTRDHEFTDWRAVENFSKEFAEELGRETGQRPWAGGHRAEVAQVV